MENKKTVKYKKIFRTAKKVGLPLQKTTATETTATTTTRVVGLLRVVEVGYRLPHPKKKLCCITMQGYQYRFGGGDQWGDSGSMGGGGVIRAGFPTISKGLKSLVFLGHDCLFYTFIVTFPCEYNVIRVFVNKYI